MANPYAISTFLDAELGEAIQSLINEKGYGHATFLIKEYMEKHKDELIAFWNKQGKDGQAIFDKWFKKWSMKKSEQDAIKEQKEKAEHDKLVKQYLVLGRTPDESEEFANAFPEKDPIEVVRIRNYNTQTERPLKKEEEEERLKDPQYKDLIQQKRGLEEWLHRAEKDPTNLAYRKEYVDKANADLVEINQKIKEFSNS